MNALKHINKYFLKYKWRFLAGIIFITASNLFAVYPAQITRIAIDYVTESNQIHEQFDGSNLQIVLFKNYTTIFLFFLLLILVSTLLKGLFMFFMRQTIIVMSRLIEYDLKNEIFNHYQQLELEFYKRNNTGDLMARISEDVSQVRMYIGPAIMYSINLIVTFILVVSIMLSISPMLTFYVILPLPFLSLGVYGVSSIINKKSEGIQKQVSKLSSFTQEAFSGIRVLKAFNREGSSAQAFEAESKKYKFLSLDLVRTDAVFQPLIIILIGLSTLLTIYIGGLQTINGQISIGNIVEFVLYVNMLTWPVTAIGWVTSIIQRASASQKRINEFLQTKSQIINPTEEKMEVIGKVEFKNVSFVYEDSGIKALQNVSFTIEAGESLAIIGKTGSGKSTIASLFCRMYDTTEGQIIIDNKNISEWNLNVLRSSIGYVPQEAFLFSDTISNNIAFGIKENMQLSKIEQAAKDAAIYDNITSFPNGFNTMVGERGITLSGGQKQRISIARAIIKYPQILLFDDCLSAVDTETEDAILKNLARIMKRKTTLIISHRLSSVKQASHIIVLDNGRVVEEGSHSELLNHNKGVYKQLYEAQLIEDGELRTKK